MSKIAMISQPMNGKSKVEIEATRNRIKQMLEEQGYEVMQTWFSDDFNSEEYSKQQEQDGVKNIPVHFLSRSIDKLSRCDLVYFCMGWQKARGCKIEQQIAEEYGIETMYE